MTEETNPVAPETGRSYQNKEPISLWKSVPMVLAAILISSCTTLIIFIVFIGNRTPDRRTLVLLFVIGLVLSASLFFSIQRVILPHWRTTPIRVKIGCILVSLLYGFILETFLPNGIPVFHIQPSRLVITALSGSGTGPDFREVTLLGFEADGSYVSYGSMDMGGDWERIGNSLIALSPPDSLYWKGRVSSTTLIFEGSPTAGRVQIDWDGDIRTYDLQELDTKEIYIHDAHPIGLPDRYLVAVLLVSTFSVYCLLSIILLLLAWRYPEDTIREWNPDLHDSRWRSDLLIILSISVASVIYFLTITQPIGLLVSADSMDYVAAARHVLAGEGYVGMDGDTFTWWPPLYPLFLAGLEVLPILGTFFWYKLANTLLMVISVVLSGFLLRRVFRQAGFFPLGALLLLVLSIPFMFSFIHLLSEALFFPLYLLFLGLLLDTIKSHDPVSGILLSLVGSLLVLNRYASVALIAYSALCLLIYLGGDIRQRLIKVTAFTAMTLMPTVLWIGRNRLMSGTWAGVRIVQNTPPLGILRSMAEIVLGWYLPVQGSWLVLGVFIFLLVLLFGVNLGAVKRSGLKHWFPEEIQVLAGWVLFYVVYLVASLSRVWIGGLAARYLYPVHLPVTIILAFWFTRLGGMAIGSWRRLLFHSSSILATVIFLIAPLNALQGINIDRATRYSQGFSLSNLERSGTLRYLNINPLPEDGPVYSNCHRCLYLYDHVFPVWSYGTEESDQLLPKDQMFYLVWFDWILTDYPYSTNTGEMPDIAKAVGKPVQLELLADPGDGRIYRVTPR